MDLSRYSWPLLSKRLSQLAWSDSQGLSELEEDIYHGIKLHPEVKEYAVFLLQLSLIKGEIEKSVAQAYKVWEAGDPLDLAVKSLYLNQLVVLNLYEQARPLHWHLIRAFDRLNCTAKQTLLNYAVAFNDAKLLSSLAEALGLPALCQEEYSNTPERRLLHQAVELLFTEFTHQIGDFRVDLNPPNNSTPILLSASINTPSVDDKSTAFYAKFQALCSSHRLGLLNTVQIRLSPLSWHLPLNFNEA